MVLCRDVFSDSSSFKQVPLKSILLHKNYVDYKAGFHTKKKKYFKNLSLKGSFEGPEMVLLKLFCENPYRNCHIALILSNEICSLFWLSSMVPLQLTHRNHYCKFSCQWNCMLCLYIEQRTVKQGSRTEKSWLQDRGPDKTKGNDFKWLSDWLKWAGGSGGRQCPVPWQ